MATPGSPPDPPPGKDADAEEVVADIEATRAELGRTVDALSEKFDLKAQARARLDEARERGARSVTDIKDLATDERGKPTATAIGAVVAALVGVLAMAVLRRRRRR